jgi:hypothetical protein
VVAPRRSPRGERRGVFASSDAGLLILDLLPDEDMILDDKFARKG